MRSQHGQAPSRRGATLALMSVFLFGMLALAALAIDMSMLRDARGEAQRAADAIALAGASAFLEPEGVPAQVDSARARALRFAQKNRIRADSLDTLGVVLTPVAVTTGPTGVVTTIETNEVTLNIIPDSQKVRAWVKRAGISTFFGGMLGVPWGHVKAMATAHASSAGTGKCLKPLAIPDIFNETSHACGNRPQDCNANKLWDTGEGWDFNPGQGDTYAPFNPDDPTNTAATGYGSAWRNSVDGILGDQGRTITIKAQRPGEAITSGFFYPWRIGESSGANDYKWNILNCNETEVSVGDSVDIEPGNMVGPTRQAFTDLINMDPGAQYNPSTNTVEGSAYGDNWRDSPRVVPLALFDPNLIAGINGGSTPIVFSNFALFFVEGFDTENWQGPPSQAPLKGRFMHPFIGSKDGPVFGPTVKRLSLIE
jgi:Putative Flp pilus-assembly TadE/G-like